MDVSTFPIEIHILYHKWPLKSKIASYETINKIKDTTLMHTKYRNQKKKI